MAENLNDPPEFTDEQLYAALKCVGEVARREAFAASRSVMVAINGNFVLMHPDGSEKVIGPIRAEVEVESKS